MLGRPGIIGCMWDVGVPAGGQRIDGITMLGFRETTGQVFDERIPQGLEVTVVLDCSPGSLRTVELPADARGFAAGLTLPETRIAGVGVDCVEVRFSPLQAASVLGVPPSELGGSLLELAEFWGRDAVRLQEQLAANSSWEERFALVSDALTERRTERSYLDDEVADAWRRITRHRGRLRVADLAPEYGWSRTRLWQRFKTQLGLTPKRASMIARFDAALGQLSAGRPIADVAVDCGYADQAHLHRDVVQFSGHTPRAIQRNPLWRMDNEALRAS